ncbi:hypothetical protein OG21DRAFT_1502631 [Imleria badia]|nr:hypothetical protein OG21DRAFT_1502631 [Imleria badia]
MRHDSSSSSATLPPLDYLQPSPVRGQLEPHDELTDKSGCHFLQCTDTPNELKVLLPPRTAQIYALLLKAELVELEKQRDASWERILDIRRLKDRMIRKCQRLAKAYSASNPGTRIPFLTLHAPPDFRVKEIEKWIRLQEGSDALKKMISPDTLRQRGSFCCDRCANLVPHHHTISGRRSSVQTAHSRRSSISEKLPSRGSSLSRRPGMSAGDMKGTNPRPPSPNRSAVNEDTIQRARGQEIRAEERASLHASNHFQENVTSHVTSIVEERAQVRASKHTHSASIGTSRFTEDKLQETKRSIHTIVEDPHEFGMDHSDRSCVESQSEVESLGRLSIISPDPIPVPYHGSTSAAFMEICDSPVDATRPEANKYRQRDSSAEEDSTPSPPSEDEPTTDGMPRLDIPRRRSSLKRNSTSELRMSMAYSTKTVSWAMDRDWVHQMTKYHAAAAQVDHADDEWGVVCQRYQEDLAGLKALRRNVTQTLSKLRIETEKLQREDEVIRDQEEKLRQGYEQLEQKHGQYRAKVKAVLQETEQVLTLCGTKRDREFQGP